MRQVIKFGRQFIRLAVKTTTAIVIGLSFLCAITVITLNIPSVQQYIVTRISEEATTLLNHKISFKDFTVSWVDEIILEDVTIKDIKGNTMIHVNQVTANINLTSIFDPPFIIDQAYISEGQFNIIIYKDSLININEFVTSIQNLSPATSDTTVSAPFLIRNVMLEGMFFSYNDLREEKLNDQFDHYHFAVDHIKVDAEDFRVRADTLQFSLYHLEGAETNTGLTIHTLRTDFLLNKNKIEFNRLYVNVNNSEIRDYFCMSYKSIDDMSEDFNNKVTLTARLKNSKVDIEDLAWFAPDLKGIQETIALSAKMKGTVSNFSINNLDLNFGRHSTLNGKLTFNGLPNVENTFTDMQFGRINLTSRDLKPYLDEATWPYLDKFDYLTGTGSFTGSFSDFLTKGEFQSALGYCKTNIALTFERNKPVKYNGHLITSEFNLGQLLNVSTVSYLNMDGNIKGSGLSPKDANLQVNAQISKIIVKNYPYRNIVTDATLRDQFFEGYISIADSNFIMNSKGLVNLNKGQEEFNIKGHIERLNVRNTYLAQVDLIAKTDYDLHFTGIELDSILGRLDFKNTYLIYNDNKELYIDSLYASVTKEDEHIQRRDFNIKSDLLDLDINGDFTIRSLYAFLQETYLEYKLALYNEKEITQAYYQKKKNSSTTHSANFFCDAKDLNAIFDIFIPGLYITKGTTADGNFSTGYTNIIRGYSHITELYYQGYKFNNCDLELDLSKIHNSSDILAMVNLQSQYQEIGTLRTQNLRLEALWNNDTINFDTYIKQRDVGNDIKLAGFVAINENENQISLFNSTVSLKDRRWLINTSSIITMRGQDFKFSDFELTRNDQRIVLNGEISKDPNKTLSIGVNNYDLSSLHTLLNSPEINGIFNGEIHLSNLYDQIRLDGIASIDNLEFQDIELGDLNGSAKWNQGSEFVGLKMEIISPKNQVIDVSGKIFKNHNSQSNEIDMYATLKQADMTILNPIFEGILSDIGGQMTGGFHVTGELTSPIIKGKVMAENATFHVPYLGTTYTVSTPFVFEPGSIMFQRMKLTDSYGQSANINGIIYHEGLKDFILDIKGEMKEFLIMNTDEEDNEMFYGKAIVTGHAEIFGPTDSITINATATSNRGTNIAIPITSGKTVTKQDYIRFNNRSLKTQQVADTTRPDLSGIAMNFNLDITEDAYTEIIFDKRAGDIIRGHGKGRIRMNVDTRGDFDMFGTYAITSGAYNYTLAGLINKEFKLDNNSTISWNGDPYQGILDIKARYNQLASLKPLFDSTTIATTPDLNKNYPVDVKLNVKGSLLSPEIALDVDILRYPTTAQVTTGIQEFKNRISNDENELNKQVFSLLILRSFASYNSFQGVSSGGGNLSELLSNQLSNFLSQVDDNLEIDINLGSLDKEALNTFQMRFSYSMMNDRLKISRDGGFYNSNSKTNTNNISNIAGEWTVEYLLSPDGKLRLKLYNRINQNANLINVNYNTTTTAGFSITHTQSFSSMNDLILGKKEKFRRDEAENFMKQLYNVQPNTSPNPGQDNAPENNQENQNDLGVPPNPQKKEDEPNPAVQ